jgi:hypothetical protein
MYWSGFLIWLEITPTGFSIAIFSIGAFIIARTKFKASTVSCGSRKPLIVQCMPEEAR